MQENPPGDRKNLPAKQIVLPGNLPVIHLGNQILITTNYPGILLVNYPIKQPGNWLPGFLVKLPYSRAVSLPFI